MMPAEHLSLVERSLLYLCQPRINRHFTKDTMIVREGCLTRFCPNWKLILSRFQNSKLRPQYKTQFWCHKRGVNVLGRWKYVNTTAVQMFQFCQRDQEEVSHSDQVPAYELFNTLYTYRSSTDNDSYFTSMSTEHLPTDNMTMRCSQLKESMLSNMI